MTLDDLGAAAGVHPLHLARAFRRYFGCSVGGYVRRLRVEAASCALLDADEPLARVAHRFGFTDQSHFTRVFARVMGVPPGRFRLGHAASRRGPRARPVQDGGTESG